MKVGSNDSKPPLHGTSSSTVSMFTLDEIVEARFRGMQRWFKCVITECHHNGTFSVKYDDGDKESNVKAGAMRKIPLYEKGDKVEARFKGKNKWYPGVISLVNGNSTYNLVYDDGDAEENVSYTMVRKREGGTVPPAVGARATPVTKTPEVTNDASDMNSIPAVITRTTPAEQDATPVTAGGKTQVTAREETVVYVDVPQPLSKDEELESVLELSSAAQHEAILARVAQSPSRNVLADIFTTQLNPPHIFVSPAKVPKSLQVADMKNKENKAAGRGGAAEDGKTDVLNKLMKNFETEKEAHGKLTVLKEIHDAIPYVTLDSSLFLQVTPFSYVKLLF